MKIHHCDSKRQKVHEPPHLGKLSDQHDQISAYVVYALEAGSTCFIDVHDFTSWGSVHEKISVKRFCVDG